jgi:excisionase family DNA binding protein
MATIMTPRETAIYLKLGSPTICSYAAQGIIPSIRIGKSWRFDKDAIDRWIKKAMGKWAGQ